MKGSRFKAWCGPTTHVAFGWMFFVLGFWLAKTHSSILIAASFVFLAAARALPQALLDLSPVRGARVVP